MRRARAPLGDLAAGARGLDAPTAHYLTRVLRLREGDVFLAFDPKSGREADARIGATTGESIVIDVGDLRERPARPEIVWIHGIAKGDKLDAIVRDATELGVTRFVVAATARAVVKLDSARGASRRERWERIAREAARQSERADAPSVEGPFAWEEALESAGSTAARFLLWEEATTPLAPLLIEAIAEGKELAFAAGPEGGLTAEEAKGAEARGWVPVSLGREVLRTETVPAAVLGAARLLSG